jgi:hypothetical protein
MGEGIQRFAQALATIALRLAQAIQESSLPVKLAALFPENAPRSASAADAQPQPAPASRTGGLVTELLPETLEDALAAYRKQQQRANAAVSERGFGRYLRARGLTRKPGFGRKLWPSWLKGNKGGGGSKG